MFDLSDSNGIKNYYKENRYLHISGKSSKKYLQIVNASFDYYSSILAGKSKRKKQKSFFHFRNKEGLPRHIIDVFNDKYSPIKKLFTSQKIRSSYEILCNLKWKYFITHSKISFKTSFKDIPWFPPQDSGYKIIGKEKSFAIFVCLEDMNISNGAFQVYPGSHKLGLLPHERRIENKFTKDGKYYIKSIPKDFLPKIISGMKYWHYLRLNHPKTAIFIRRFILKPFEL